MSVAAAAGRRDQRGPPAQRKQRDDMRADQTVGLILSLVRGKVRDRAPDSVDLWLLGGPSVDEDAPVGPAAAAKGVGEEAAGQSMRRSLNFCTHCGGVAACR